MIFSNPINIWLRKKGVEREKDDEPVGDNVTGITEIEILECIQLKRLKSWMSLSEYDG